MRYIRFLALTRRHPLTIEGQDIGSFEVSISCSDTPDMYQVAYREKRLIDAGTPADRVNGVRMMIRREPVRLKLESSSAASKRTNRWATRSRMGTPATPPTSHPSRGTHDDRTLRL